MLSSALGGCGHHSDTYESARSAMRAGDLDLSQRQSDAAIAQALAAGDQTTEWRFRLLRCEVMLARQAPGKALTELRSPIPGGTNFVVLGARRKALEGLALMKLGRLEEAATVLAAAEILSEQSRDPETEANTQTIEGTLLLRTARWAAAETKLQSALARAKLSPDSVYLQAGALLDLGMSRLNRHRFDEAAGYFEQAAALAVPFPNLYAVAQANLASCYYNLGEPDRAIRLQLASVSQFERSGARSNLEAALGETGNAYLTNGQLREAAAYLNRALDAAKRMSRNADAAIWAGNLALIYTELGEWDNAERLNEEAIRLKGAANLTLVYNQLNSARIAVGRKDFAKGENLYREALAKQANPGVRWDAWAGLGEAAMMRGKPALASKYLESAVEVVEQTRAELLSNEFKLPFLTRLIRVYQEYVDALIAQGDYEGALAVAESSRAQVLSQRFGSDPARRLDVAALKSGAAGTAFVSYWLGPRASHAWIVSAGRIRHFDLPPGPAIAALTDDYNAAIRRRLANPLATPVASGRKLFEILLQPLLPWIPAGGHVVIVPDGALNELNFETLVVPDPSPHYWVEDAIVAVAPSIASPLQAAPASSGAGLLMVGDPEITDPAFPPLLHAASEIHSVASHYDPGSSVVLTGRNATLKGYLDASPGKFAVIHFAAHATANLDNPLASAVLLTGGRLFARNVIDLPLHADLVTISACQSAGLRFYSGEGLVGFAWAFLRAGARNVIAGLWDVNDQSTAALMDTTYREFAAGAAPPEALRIAKLNLAHSKTNFQKPYYWGAFQVYTVKPS